MTKERKHLRKMEKFDCSLRNEYIVTVRPVLMTTVGFLLLVILA